MEKRTEELAAEARAIIEDMEDLGGMTKAIIQGIPKYNIEECSARRQAKIDAGLETLVGVNKYRLEKEEDYKPFKIEQDKELEEKLIKRVQELRKNRDKSKVEATLDKITEAAQTGEGNLLELSIEAVKARATVGEVCYALEKVWGRYIPKEQIVRGVYGKEKMESDSGKEMYKEALLKVQGFANKEGRNPRILVAKVGQDGHDRGAKVIASGFADLGYDVEVTGLFTSPDEVAWQAVDGDVHVIGVSILSASHNTLIPQIREALVKNHVFIFRNATMQSTFSLSSEA